MDSVLSKKDPGENGTNPVPFYFDTISYRGEAGMVEDYSVTWSEVIGIVDKLIERNEPMSMGEIESAVRKAWKIIFDDRCKKYGITFEQEGR